MTLAIFADRLDVEAERIRHYIRGKDRAGWKYGEADRRAVICVGRLYVTQAWALRNAHRFPD